jgi:hypothetical protein
MKYYRDSLQTGYLSYLGEAFQSIHAWHIDIEKNYIRSQVNQLLESMLSASRPGAFERVVSIAHGSQEEGNIVFIVIDKKDMPFHVTLLLRK